MGKVTYADGIAIYQLIFYSPAFLASIYVATRHGAMKSSGWILLTIFCIIRIVGSSARIATITNSSGTTAYTIALVCSLLGLSPLLMASLGLISRAYYAMLKQPWGSMFSLYGVKIVHAPAVVALILCIVGATNAPTPEQIDAQTTVHVGIVLYLVVLTMLTLLAIGALVGHREIEEGEPRIVVAVLSALPFIFVRLLYSLLSVFSGSHKFNLLTGSQTITLFMSVLPEMVVAIIYIATGLKLKAVPASIDSSPSNQLSYRAGRGDFGMRRFGLFGLATAAFQAVRHHQDAAVVPETEQKHKHERRRRQSAV